MESTRHHRRPGMAGSGLFDKQVMANLVRARERGVDVRVILPHVSDSRIGVTCASKRNLSPSASASGSASWTCGCSKNGKSNRPR